LPRPERHFVDPQVAPVRRRAGSAFTLIELLIVVAIIGVLLTLIFPAVRGTLGAARGFRCQSSQRTIAFDFSIFADDDIRGSRGEDDQVMPPGLFRIETFQNSQYGINEFWEFGQVPWYRVPDTKGRDPMRCSEVRGPLDLYRYLSCASGGVRPPQNVSFGFNARLHFSDARAAAGLPFGVALSSKILEGYGLVSTANIPLLMDVDGQQAAAAGRSPFFTAPTANAQSNLFGNNSLWWPGDRHNGAMNIAFVDGHVSATKRPVDEPGIAWDFEPPQPTR
jgi:prepilin-type processing-associated H-X9-DG protein/prepilin-type N-terminal cleavage/methylation domain-containing protein